VRQLGIGVVSPGFSWRCSDPPAPESILCAGVESAPTGVSPIDSEAANSLRQRHDCNGPRPERESCVPVFKAGTHTLRTLSLQSLSALATVGHGQLSHAESEGVRPRQTSPASALPLVRVNGCVGSRPLQPESTKKRVLDFAEWRQSGTRSQTWLVQVRRSGIGFRLPCLESVPRIFAWVARGSMSHESRLGRTTGPALCPVLLPRDSWSCQNGCVDTGAPTRSRPARRPGTLAHDRWGDSAGLPRWGWLPLGAHQPSDSRLSSIRPAQESA